MNRMALGFTPTIIRLSLKCVLRWCLCAIVTSIFLSPIVFGSDNVPWQTLASDSEDAPLRYCGAASLDNLWAVGDRGLVMRSTDGGRSWRQVPVGSNADLRQIAFADNKVGYIVGGFIWPVTGRSDGCLLRTIDGGETWKYAPIMSIGRLSGLQLFSKDLLYAWGDWSAEQRGALLESQDGGMTFHRKDIPCSQIAASAWLNPNQGVVIDRLSRVFVTKNGNDYRQVELPASPLSPIRAAGTDGNTVWLSGDNAQLYKSSDLLTWEKVSLNALDASNIIVSLTSIRVSPTGQVWLTTNVPGVMLSSADGKSFQVHQTACQTQLHSVCCVSPEQIVAVGAMNNIIETRNAGEGWWVKNQAGSKLGMLVIAPRLQDIALDALVQSSLGEKQHAGALIIHSQDAISKADAWPDGEQRFQQMCSVSVCSWTNVLSKFPIGSMSGNAIRKSDLLGYESNGADPSAIEKELIFAIRALRPDVVVVATSDQNSQLATRASSAAYHAIQLAADPRFQLLASDAVSELPAWRVQRALSRIPKATTNGLADWTIEPTGVLGSSGQTVGDRVRIAAGLLQSPQDATCLFNQESPALKSAAHESICWNRTSLYGNYLNRSTNNRARGQFTSCYFGLLQSEGAKRPVSDAKVKNLQELMATMNLNKALNTLAEMDLSTEPQRTKWLQYLNSYIETLSSEDRSRFLLELGLIYQHRGNAGQWALCEEFLIAEPKSSVWKEIAIAQAMQFASSAEYQKVFGTLVRSISGSRPGTGDSSNAVQPAAFVSPFEVDKIGLQESKTLNSSLVSGSVAGPQGAGSVYTATFTQQKIDLQVPPRSNTQSAGSRDTANDDASVVAGANSIPLMEIAKKNLGPNLSDIRTLFSRISRERKAGPVDEKLTASLKGLSNCDGILGWSQLASRDIAVFGKANSPNRVLDSAIPRPNLDGILNDEIWQASTAIMLSSPWPNEIENDSQVRITNDDQFLYLGIQCSKVASGSAASQGSNKKRATVDSKIRDASMDESDHVSVRIDFDQDYQTYYQFSISADRTRQDSLNHFVSWDPKWFVDQSESGETWIAEVAIPLEELIDLDAIPHVIAVNARRQVPGIGIQNVGGLPADGWMAQTFQLVPLAATNDQQ